MALGPDDLADLEGDAGAILKMAGLEDDEPPDMDRVCVALTGSVPRMGRGRTEGRTTHVQRVYRIELRPDIIGTPRGREVLGHESGHVWFPKFRNIQPTEEMCDALGVLLAAPRRASRRAMAALGHRVHRLAEALQVTQSASLLRVGEISNRSVALCRGRGEIIQRGEPFDWPAIEAVLRERPSTVHAVRTDARWGLMRAA
jgi:hypothetical protein